MTYLYRHSNDEHDILIDFMPFLWDWISNDTKATVEYKSFSSQGINDVLFFNIFKNYKNFSNNTNFVGIRFRISMSCFDMKVIFSSFFGFMIGAFFNESTDIYDIFALSITTTTFHSLGEFAVNVFSNQSSNTTLFISSW